MQVDVTAGMSDGKVMSVRLSPTYYSIHIVTLGGNRGHVTVV